MTKRIFPAIWKVCSPENPVEGGVIPLQGASTDLPGTCPNCENVPPGLVYGWFLDRTSKFDLHFQVGGERKGFPGRLLETPCPTCGTNGPEATGVLPKVFWKRPVDDRPKYWDN